MVTPENLRQYLGVPEGQFTTDRAQILITDVLTHALSVATVGTVGTDGPTWINLPAGGDAVVRAAAGRAYTNAAGVTAETAGPFSVQRPAPSGSLLSAAERRTLRRLAGRAGAFAITTTPATAAATFTDPLTGLSTTAVDQIELDTALDV